MDEIDGQVIKEQLDWCLQIHPGVYDNASNTQHKVGNACKLCIRRVYENRIARLFN